MTINRHLVNARIGDEVNFNTSNGTCGATIIALDSKEVTLQTGTTLRGIHKLPLDVDCGTLRNNFTKAEREPEYVRHTGRAGHCGKCRSEGYPNGEEPCARKPISKPVSAHNSPKSFVFKRSGLDDHDVRVNKFLGDAQTLADSEREVVTETLKIKPLLQAKMIPTDSIKAHPLSVRVYGEPTAPEELLRSIKEIGVVQPIVVKGNLIIAGTSRHYAAVRAGYKEIPAVLFGGTDLEAEWLVLESNRQRVKLASQVGREFIERCRLVAAAAKLRQGRSIPPELAGSAGDARDIAAKAFDMGRSTLEKLAKVIVKADEGNQRAQQTLTALDEGSISISAAFVQVTPVGTPQKCPRCPAEFPSKTQLRKHCVRDHNLLGNELDIERGDSKYVQKPDPRFASTEQKRKMQERQDYAAELQEKIPSDFCCHVFSLPSGAFKITAINLSAAAVKAISTVLKHSKAMARSTGATVVPRK